MRSRVPRPRGKALRLAGGCQHSQRRCACSASGSLGELHKRASRLPGRAHAAVTASLPGRGGFVEGWQRPSNCRRCRLGHSSQRAAAVPSVHRHVARRRRWLARPA
eukprot:825853-Prymnesium_polylepis.1